MPILNRKMFGGFSERRKEAIVLNVVRPAIGEVFTLTINGGDPWLDPLKMLYYDGYDPEEWEFIGKAIEGVHTRQFKLEIVKDCSNIDEVLTALNGRGKAPEGQWRTPFAKTYKMASLREQLGVPDPSWVDQYSEAHFPCLTLHRTLFHHADDIRRGGEGWVWLVKVE